MGTSEKNPQQPMPSDSLARNVGELAGSTAAGEVGQVAGFVPIVDLRAEIAEVMRYAADAAAKSDPRGESPDPAGIGELVDPVATIGAPFVAPGTVTYAPDYPSIPAAAQPPQPDAPAP